MLVKPKSGLFHRCIFLYLLAWLCSAVGNSIVFSQGLPVPASTPIVRDVDVIFGEYSNSQPSAYIDLGSLEKNELYRLKLRIRNSMTKPVHAQTVRASCSCLNVKIPPLQLEPGTETTGELEFRTWGNSRESIIHLDLLDNPLKGPFGEIVLKGWVAGVLAFSDSDVAVSINKPSAEWVFPVVFSAPVYAKNLEIDVLESADGLKAELLTDGEKCAVRVSFSRNEVDRDFVRAVILIRDKQLKSEARMNLAVFMRGPVTISPIGLRFRKTGDTWTATALLDTNLPEGQELRGVSLVINGQAMGLEHRPLGDGTVSRLVATLDNKVGKELLEQIRAEKEPVAQWRVASTGGVHIVEIVNIFFDKDE